MHYQLGVMKLFSSHEILRGPSMHFDVDELEAIETPVRKYVHSD